VKSTVDGFVAGIGVAIFTLLLTGCGSQQPGPTPTPSPEPPAIQGTIVAMGDSLTEGLGVSESEAYPALLEQKLQADGYTYQVINAGVSGETSTGALARVGWILNLKPDIVILETGGNDGLRAIDPTLTQENISEIIDQFQANGTQVVLAGMETIQNLGREYTTAYAEIYPTVAADKGTILIPFFLEGVAAQPDLNQSDGIHPTAEGYQIVVETVYPYVIDAIKQQEQTP
jgi:acyl-CoA thioesterase-1